MPLALLPYKLALQLHEKGKSFVHKKYGMRPVHHDRREHIEKPKDPL